MPAESVCRSSPGVGWCCLAADEDKEWQTIAELEGGPRTSYTVSFQNLLPSTDYVLRLLARNRLGISPPAYAPEHVLTPSE